MLLAVSLSDDRLKFPLHLFFGEVECPMGSAECLLEPTLARLDSVCQVGSFQPRFEIGLHAHRASPSGQSAAFGCRFKFGGLCSGDRSSSATPIVFSRKACLTLGSSVMAATKLQVCAPSVGLSGGDSGSGATGETFP
jgi:hypothetical protein